MVWIVWGQGGLGALGIGGVIVVPFLPSTIFLACMNWAVGALPVVVLRKVYLTGETFVDPCSWNVWYRWELPISGSNPSHFLDHTKSIVLPSDVDVCSLTVLCIPEQSLSLSVAEWSGVLQYTSGFEIFVNQRRSHITPVHLMFGLGTLIF